MGVKLVPYPRHTASIKLILDMHNVLVSPHIQMEFDNFHNTVRPLAANKDTS